LSPAWGWRVAAGLLALHVGLAAAVATRVRAPVTYVLTPFVDVVPSALPLTAEEAARVATGARSAEARGIQAAYARMGSTLSLDDLLRAIEAVEAGPAPLSGRSRARITSILDAARADHAAMLEVQAEILDLERQLDAEVDRLLAALPEDARGRVLQGVGP